MTIKRGDMPATGNNLDSQSAGCMSEFNKQVRVDDLGRWQSGMTIREKFAMFASPDTKGLTMGDVKALIGMEYTANGIHNLSVSIALEAKIKVMKADALLAELEKSK